MYCINFFIGNSNVSLVYIALHKKNYFAALRALAILGSLTRRGAARPAAHRSLAAHIEKSAKNPVWEKSSKVLHLLLAQLCN